MNIEPIESEAQNFNSTVVRLKLSPVVEDSLQLHNFNSTVVRLKHVRAGQKSDSLGISIPLWYD